MDFGDYGLDGLAIPARVELLSDAMAALVAKLPLVAEFRPWANPVTGDIQGIELTDLFADSPGNGAGTFLMRELGRLADESDVNVYVHPDSVRAREFYERFGFERSAQARCLVRCPPLPHDD
jgi:ribosomal protein S18 acetylase RimI-like enzyme